MKTLTNLELLALAVFQRSQKMKRQRLVVALLVGSGILAAALVTTLAPVPAAASPPDGYCEQEFSHGQCRGRSAQSEAPLLDNVVGIWAIDDRSNCRVTSRIYSLSVSREDGVITWMDGHGNTDVERVIYSDSDEFRTMTVGSFHSGHGNRVGTGWVYSSTDSLEVIRVTKVGKSFYIVRCPAE